MSNIDFKLLVEELLNENLTSVFVPPGTSPTDTSVLQAIEVFTKSLHSGGRQYINKEYLISNKPYWPYADTLEYITIEASRIQPRIAPDFTTLLNKVVNVLKTLPAPTNTSGTELVKALLAGSNTTTQQALNNDDIGNKIQDKISNLQKNHLNYRNYSNTRLAQANNETSVLAAEPYLEKTPKDAVIAVLKDFGGYDQSVAEQVIKFPAEPKYTQRAKNIDNMVMQNIIEISKLTLIFYREWVQSYANQIVDLLNFDRDYQQTVSRTFMVQQQQLVQALQYGAGTQDKENFFKKILNSISTYVGTEKTPTEILEKLFYMDYLKFIEGKSSLVLKPESYSINQSHDSLIKKIRDFDGQPGKGQNIYESYIHLFNNIKKGELTSSLGTKATYARQAMGAVAGFGGAKLYG
jgi:hypothetical protein